MLTDAQDLGTIQTEAATARKLRPRKTIQLVIQRHGTVLEYANTVRGANLSVTSLLLFVAGCGSGISPSPQLIWTSWARGAGGVVDGPEQVRADRALSRLGLGRPSPISVHVLSNETLGAWTFADGNIFVSRALVRALNNDELAAALAHEAGHLRAEGFLAPGGAFDGAAGSLSCEERADDLGRSRLITRGIPQLALISALQKVRDAGSISPFLRAALDSRIRRLTRQCATMPAGRELLDTVPITH